ncbi:transcriptional regulator [Nostoc sp. 3335mG]|nr:transcriptional regulator [Nostoc sp. 3335mG]
MTFISRNPLSGCRVLLVEDESLVAALVEDLLLDAGCDVVLAMRLDEAMAVANEGEVELGILDVNLGEERSYPVADALRARGTPFIFATGYGRNGLNGAYSDVPVLQKPYRAAELLRCAADALAGQQHKTRKMVRPTHFDDSN